MSDDRQPTTIIVEGREIPLDEFVALNPILKPWRDRGVTYKRVPPTKPLAAVKQAKVE